MLFDLVVWWFGVIINSVDVTRLLVVKFTHLLYCGFDVLLFAVELLLGCMFGW